MRVQIVAIVAGERRKINVVEAGAVADVAAPKDHVAEPDDGSPFWTPPPVEQDRFDRFTPREFASALLEGMVRNGIFTKAKATAILEDAISALKR